MTERLPLRVTLAGYNVDRETLDMLKAAAAGSAEAPPDDAITPETISAAYARISRNPADVGEIRAQARSDVAKARQSNERIVFGLGHASVAEHAAFNIDVTGISRLAVEAVERHRLASFTEKSQRYIKLDGDAVVPPEIVQLGLGEEFLNLIDAQNRAYEELYPKVFDYYFPLFKNEGIDRPKTEAKGRASEDSRYVVSLATEAQFGMTVNARTLEIMIRDALAHPLEEVRRYGLLLHEQVQPLAPSLVKYASATDYERVQFDRQGWCVQDSSNTATHSMHQAFDQKAVRLIDYSANGEEMVLAALYVNQTGSSWEDALRLIQNKQSPARIEIIKDTLRACAAWDPPPREFELAEFSFEVVLSAAAFGQLKRHRMATLLQWPYDGSLGWTTPPSIIEAGGQDIYDAILNRSAEFARKIINSGDTDLPDRAREASSTYALCNGHRRRVLFRVNARELYHVSRLREDLHAQWDIRQLATDMLKEVRRVMPNLFILAAGKHEFEDVRRQVYGNEKQDT